MVQADQQKIRSRLRRYERALAKERKELGTYRDGAGKRYEIAPHYMLLDDNEGTIAAFQWFEREFDDDSGRPDHLLCWSLALHRAVDEVGAAKKLRQAMLSNLYLLPHLLGCRFPSSTSGTHRATKNPTSWNRFPIPTWISGATRYPEPPVPVETRCGPSGALSCGSFPS